MRSCLVGRSSAGSIAAMFSSSTRSTAENPSSVDAETRALFERWTPPSARGDHRLRAAGAIPLEKVVGAVNLAESIRRYGHLAAGSTRSAARPPIGDPSLLAATHGVTDEDLRSLPANLVAGPLDGATTAYDAIESLRRIYCSTTGYDYAHVFVPEEREWLRAGGRARPVPRARPIRSIRSSCSTGCRRSKRSSAFSTARFPARRASRSRGSTCSCRSSTR